MGWQRASSEPPPTRMEQKLGGRAIVWRGAPSPNALSILERRRQKRREKRRRRRQKQRLNRSIYVVTDFLNSMKLS